MEHSTEKRRSNKKKGLVVGLFAAVLLAFVPISVYATSAKLSVTSGVLSKGDTLDINVKGESEGRGTYASSDRKVAIVTKKGVVTAKKAGNATITWKKGRKTLSCKLKVVKAPGLDRTKLTVEEGKQEKIGVKRNGNSALAVSWSSKNKKIATVKGGIVTGVSAGKTTVMAKIKGNSKTWTKKVTVTVKKADNANKAESVVYMTEDISPKGMMAAYEALGWTPTGRVAVKLSTGEPPASNYLRPELIRDLVQSVQGTIVECNTAYGGSRAETAMHYQVAKDHGFTDIADFQILDEDGSMSIPVKGGTQLTENFVGRHFADYDSYLVLSHFKGHAMAGFGGAIKNISIGLGSSEGKSWIHSAGSSKSNPWGGDQDSFLESMGEAGKAVSDYLGNGERIVYINVMNRLSVDCDCDGKPSV